MADTDILLTVDLDIANAEKTAEQLQQEVRGIFDSRKGESSASLSSLEIQMKKTYDRATELRESLSALADTKIPTAEYTEVSNRVQKMNAEFDKLLIKQDEMMDAGKNSGTAWDALNDKMDRLGTLIREDEAELRRLTESGEGFTLGKDSSQYVKMQQELDSTNDRLKQQIIHYREIENKGQSAGRKVAGAMHQVKSASDKVRQSTKKTSSEMSKGFENAFKKIKKVGLRLALILVGVRSLRALIMKIRSAVLEGFKNLQESGVGRLKERMNDLTNAATTLKNSIAAAFEPIVTAAIPRIQQLVEWLTVAIDKLGQFIAAMRGQTKYVKAIKQVGDASKKANKELSKLDNLNVLTSEKNGAAGMFEEVDIPDEMITKVEELKKHIQDIKNALDKYIFGPIKQFLAWLISPITNNIDKIILAFKNLKRLLDFILDKVREKISHTFGVLKDVYEEYIKPTMGKISAYLTEFLGIFLDFWNDHQADFQWIAEQFNAIWDESIQPVIDSAIKLLGSLFALIGSFVTSGDLENLRAGLNGLWEFLFPKYQQFLLGVRNGALFVSEHITKSMDAARRGADFIRQLLERTGSRWTTFKLVVVAVFDAIRAAISDAMDSLMKFTEVVDALTGTKLTNLLQVIQGFDTSSSGKSTPGKGKHVRGAASGAVIPPTVSEHFIKVGDNKQETEIVSPLSTMQEAMINALQAAGIGGGSQEIVINMDGREILKALVKQNNEYKKQHNGASALA